LLLTLQQQQQPGIIPHQVHAGGSFLISHGMTACLSLRQNTHTSIIKRNS